MTSWAPWWFLGPVATTADSNGDFNKIPLQPMEQKQRMSGARPIFRISHLRNGRPTRRISTLWITAFGQFWMPGPACAGKQLRRKYLHKNVKALKQSLPQGWDDCRKSCGGALSFQKRSTLCIEAEVNHFEKNLKYYSQNCSLTFFCVKTVNIEIGKVGTK